MNGVLQPFVSIIIPFLNDVQRLKICLGALDQQTYPKDRFEIILIDNGSEESLDNLEAFSANIHLSKETKPGSYAARNKGISLAKGDVIAFTDADCIPQPDWLAKGVAKLFHSPACGLVGGRIEVFCHSLDNPTATELYELLVAFPQERFVTRQHFSATANLFTFKSVFEKIGLFDANLKSGGDFDWGTRVFAAGYTQMYADDTCVLHPARYSIAEIAQKQARVVRGLYQIYSKEGYPFRLLIRHIRHERPRPKDFLNIGSDQRLKNRKQKVQVLFVMTIVKFVKVWKRTYLWLKDYRKNLLRLN